MKKKRQCHWYTAEEVEFIKLNCKGHSFRELTELFNAHFSLLLTVEQIKGAMNRYHLQNGRDTRFKPGHVPSNKGEKGIHRSPATEFKPGHMPVNHKPVGTERISKDGIIEIKIKEPRTWRSKHRVIWEKENGPVPRGHVVIFADGDRRNFSPENLLLVSRSELVVMNHKNLIYRNQESTRSGQIVAALILKISERKRKR